MRRLRHRYFQPLGQLVAHELRDESAVLTVAVEDAEDSGLRGRSAGDREIGGRSGYRREIEIGAPGRLRRTSGERSASPGWPSRDRRGSSRAARRRVVIGDAGGETGDAWRYCPMAARQPGPTVRLGGMRRNGAAEDLRDGGEVAAYVAGDVEERIGLGEAHTPGVRAGLRMRCGMWGRRSASAC